MTRKHKRDLEATLAGLSPAELAEAAKLVRAEQAKRQVGRRAKAAENAHAGATRLKKDGQTLTDSAANGYNPNMVTAVKERDSLAVSFGLLVRKKREELGLSQQELADMANLSQVAISNIETGQAMARPSTRQRIARAFGITPPELACV